MSNFLDWVVIVLSVICFLLSIIGSIALLIVIIKHLA